MSLQNSDVRTSLATVRPVRHRQGAHSIHPYFGKVDPALATRLIEMYSHQGETVLDPFCGSGTVLHEALLLKRSCLGWDSSPLAVIISASKLTVLDRDDVNSINNILGQLQAYRSDAGLFRKRASRGGAVPEMPRVLGLDYWFTPSAIIELSYLKKFLRERGRVNDRVELLLTTAFSRIITQASNQQGESTYRRVTKPAYEGRIFDLFLDAVDAIITANECFAQMLQERTGTSTCISQFKAGVEYTVRYDQAEARITVTDTRNDSVVHRVAEPISLVVTSPPYLMSWDYGLYHKFRFYWLDIDLDSYEETEIGRHLRRKRDDVERYTNDMLSCFSSIDRVMKQGGVITLVNAPSVVYGDLVDTNEILRKCGVEVGWRLEDCVPSIDIPGPHHGMYASLTARSAKAPGERGKKEHVLIFRKPAQ